MDTINSIIEYFSANPTGLIIAAVLLATYYGLMPILKMYKCHQQVLHFQKLGGVPRWTFKKCLTVKLRSMTWDKIFKPSKYNRKRVTIKGQIGQYISMFTPWFSEWTAAIRSYSPRAQKKIVDDLNYRLDTVNTRYCNYYDKYHKLYNDCGTVMEYIDKQIPDTKIKFDDILLAAKEEHLKKDKENAEKLGSELESTDSTNSTNSTNSNQASLFA